MWPISADSMFAFEMCSNCSSQCDANRGNCSNFQIQAPCKFFIKSKLYCNFSSQIGKLMLIYAFNATRAFMYFLFIRLQLLVYVEIKPLYFWCVVVVFVFPSKCQTTIPKRWRTAFHFVLMADFGEHFVCAVMRQSQMNCSPFHVCCT